MFVVPADNDVVFGGSRIVRCHAGNDRFERIIKLHLEEYQKASKKRRSDIITNIVDEVQSRSKNGFLQRDPISKKYYVIPEHRVVSPVVEMLIYNRSKN
jgi:hypothetical protein